MRILLAMAVMVLCLAPANASAQSGFLRAPYSGYAKLSFTTLSSNDFYDTSGNLSNFGGDFTQRNLQLYGEVGLHKYLTAGINATVLRLNSFENSDTAAGLGDLRLFAKSGLQFLGFHAAGIVEVELPTGRSEANVDTEFEGVRTNLPTGDGETNIWFRLALSRSIPVADWLNAYFSVHGGLNLRTEFAEQIEIGGELGGNILGWVLVQGTIGAQFTPTATENLDPRGIFLFGEGTEFVVGGASVSVRLPSTPLWLSFDYRNTFANLRNLYAGSTFGLGLAVEWQ